MKFCSFVHKFAQAERERRLESGDAERRAIEFHVFARGMMWRVVGGDCVDAAVGKALHQRIAVFARSERRIHFVVGVVADVLVGEREMMRRDFAGDAQALLLCKSHVFERAEVDICAMCNRAPVSRRYLHVAADANRFGLRRNSLQAQAHRRGPSRITPPAKSDGSSQWSITGRPSALQ